MDMETNWAEMIVGGFLEDRGKDTEREQVYVIACKTVIEEMRPYLQPGTSVREMEFSLHRSPEKLRAALQNELDAAPAGHTVLLGYGLCGGGLDRLVARHNRIVVPRVHDCIALFLGSSEAHREETEREVGTYYLTKGWLETGEYGPLGQYERLVQKYGLEQGAEMARLAFVHYTRLALINTGHYAMDHYRQLARQTAELYHLRFEEISGSPTLVRALAEAEWDERFLIFEPNEEIHMSAFL